MALECWNGSVFDAQVFLQQSTYTFPLLLQAGYLQNPPPTGYSIIYDNYVVVDAAGIVRYTSQNQARHPSTGRFYDPQLRAAIDAWLPAPTSADEHPADAAAFYVRAQTPASGGVRISFGLPQSAAVAIEIFDVTGRRRRVIDPGRFLVGRHSVTWDRTDVNGRTVAAGTYFVRLRAGTHSGTSRIVLVLH